MTMGFTMTNNTMNTINENTTSFLDDDERARLSRKMQSLDLSKLVGESVIASLRNGQDLMGEIVRNNEAYWLRPDTVDPDGGYFPRHFKNNGQWIQLGNANGMIVTTAIKKIHTLVSLSYNQYNKEFHADILWSCGGYNNAGAYDQDGKWLSDSELVEMADSWDHETDGKKERILKSTIDPEAEFLKVKADIRKREHERNMRKLEKKMARRSVREATGD